MSIDSPEEERVADDISLEQANRFLAKAIDPFQFRLAHPERGTRDAARREIQQSADADTDAAMELVQMVVNPEFLFWYTKGNEQDVWLGGIYVCNDFFFMAFEEAMVCSDNSQGRMFFQQIIARGVRYAWLTAEEIETVAFFAEKRQHVRPVDVFLHGISDMFRGDFYADTICPHSVCLIQ